MEVRPPPYSLFSPVPKSCPLTHWPPQRPLRRVPQPRLRPPLGRPRPARAAAHPRHRRRDR
jgi:hypothetical protein